LWSHRQSFDDFFGPSEPWAMTCDLNLCQVAGVLDTGQANS
jgi:hypothetical protein